MDMKEVEKFEPKVGALKLSEAIRIGAAKRPQATGWCFFDGRSCAIGAMYEGMTGSVPEGYASGRAMMMDLPKAWFVDIRERLSTPIFDEIWKRNDDGITREQIADWLEGQGL